MAGGISGFYNDFGSPGSSGPPQQAPIGMPGAARFTEGWGQPTAPAGPVSPSTALQNQYKLYDSGVQTQASDYDNIMGGYRNLASSNITPQTYTPSTYSYAPTANFQSSVANLQDLAKTGGYTPQGIADLRARGISPIRSIYDSARRNVDRQRSLQGGYSPSYTAASAKMARDESQQISDAEQNVNAGLAQNIASNRLAIAPALSSATGQENALSASYGSRATDIGNEGKQVNIQNDLNAQGANRGNTLAALDAMRSLYGTTPALAALFGNQALQTAGLVQNDTNNTTTAGTNLARLIASGMR